MPTTYTDQFWVMDPFNPPPVGTFLTVETFDIVDNNDNNLINRFSNDRIDGVDIRASYPGDTVTVELADSSVITITGVTFYLRDGREVFTPTDGNVLPDATLVSTSYVTTQGSVTPTELQPVCFTAGTMIATANGLRPVEELAAGDLVVTADAGLVPISMVHERVMTHRQLRAQPNHRPVKISTGALGHGLPVRDLIVSPQHRIVLRSEIVQRMFGVQEILVPACQLVGYDGITRLDDQQPAHYIHILLDHHGVIFAQGAPCETLYLGAQIHETLSPREIEIIRTTLAKGANFTMEPARLFVRGKRLRHLLERHISNDKALLNEQCVPAEIVPLLSA